MADDEFYKLAALIVDLQAALTKAKQGGTAAMASSLAARLEKAEHTLRLHALGKLEELTTELETLREPVETETGEILKWPFSEASAPSRPAKVGAKLAPLPTAPQHSDAARILDVAKRYLGQPYGHLEVELGDPDWQGAFDCAEFASYCLYRANGVTFGTRPLGAVSGTNAYTGYWKEDVEKFGIAISIEEALSLAGAFLLRYPPSGGMGHIAISLGNGAEIYEAHGTADGVIRNSALGRRWDTGIKIPDLDYVSVSHDGETLLARRGEAFAQSTEIVRKIQRALVDRGFLSGNFQQDTFDVPTENAVIRFQEKMGLVVDGEVGPDTGAALGLASLWSNAGPDDPSDKQPGKQVAIAWGGYVGKKFGSSAFKQRVMAIASTLSCDPNHLMAVMAFETGRTFSPSVKNAAGSGATGLIQFTPATAKWLGTSINALENMSAIEQLDWVENYLTKICAGRPAASLSDLYATVLLPSAFGKPDSYILFEDGTLAYEQNRGLDSNKDGKITKAEAAQGVSRKLIEGLKDRNIG